MVNKYLFRKINMTAAGMSKNEQTIELEYYLIESEIDYVSELSGKKVYGIGIIKNLGNGCFEEAMVRNYSCSKNNVSSVLSVISNNEVTPTGLTYVLEDIVS
jgi:hypothetical protein